MSLALKDGFFTTAPPGRPLSHLSPRLFLRCVLALLLGASQVRCEQISAEAALPTCHPHPLLTVAWSHPRRLCPARLPGLTDTRPLLRLSGPVFIAARPALACALVLCRSRSGREGPSLTLRTTSDLLLPLGGCLLFGAGWLSPAWQRGVSLLIRRAVHRPAPGSILPGLSAPEQQPDHRPLMPPAALREAFEGLSSLLDPQPLPLLVV